MFSHVIVSSAMHAGYDKSMLVGYHKKDENNAAFFTSSMLHDHNSGENSVHCTNASGES